MENKNKDKDFIIVTYKDLFNEAENKMFYFKSEKIDNMIDFIENECCEELGIELESTFLKDFLDLCAGKSSYIDNEIEDQIKLLEEHEEEICSELGRIKKK